MYKYLFYFILFTITLFYINYKKKNIFPYIHIIKYLIYKGKNLLKYMKGYIIKNYHQPILISHTH